MGGISASFKLRAIGGFLISAQRSSTDDVTAVTIEVPAELASSSLGMNSLVDCRVLNPYNTSSVLVNGVAMQLVGGVLHLRLKRGQRYELQRGTAKLLVV